MSWLNLLGISLGLGMDAFAVSIAAGLSVTSITTRHAFRLAFHFGLFQFMMPILGWGCGRSLTRYIESFDHWLAFGLLGFIGVKMLQQSRNDSKPALHRDPTRGGMLVLLSLATSIDALAVGLGLAFLGVTIWLPSAVIGIVAAVLTTVGLSLGSRLGSKFGSWAYIFGGCILILIGSRILITHLFG